MSAELACLVRDVKLGDDRAVVGDLQAHAVARSSACRGTPPCRRPDRSFALDAQAAVPGRGGVAAGLCGGRASLLRRGRRRGRATGTRARQGEQARSCDDSRGLHLANGSSARGAAPVASRRVTPRHCAPGDERAEPKSARRSHERQTVRCRLWCDIADLHGEPDAPSSKALCPHLAVLIERPSW